MRLDDAFLAVSDANRRHLLEELRRGPKTVGELAAGLPISRPAVSQHLKVLLGKGRGESTPSIRRASSASTSGSTSSGTATDVTAVDVTAVPDRLQIDSPASSSDRVAISSWALRIIG